MGRISLVFALLILIVVKGAAQYGGYSNLQFVENKGQWNSLIKYRAQMSSGNFYLLKQGFAVMLHDTGDLRRIQEMMHGGHGASSASQGSGADNAPILHSHVYRVSFQNANDQVEIVPDKPSPGYNNYFFGNDPSQWVNSCKIYQGVIYKNIYEGIDLHYYTNDGILKYDLIVHPGADPGKIALKYEGQDNLSVRKNQVLIKTSVGMAKESIPSSYQLDDKERKDVDCDYIISGGNTIKFRIRNYSPDATLVIDPTEVFCSFTGSASDNWGYTATYDASGNAYAGGIVLNTVDDGNGFLTTTGAYQQRFMGGDTSEGNYAYDVAIMKFNSTGSKIIYSTYLGGHGDEQPHSMVVDNSGNLIVAGRTSSADFPSKPANSTFGAGGGLDIFITKFNANGTGLIGSRRIGGTGDDGVNYSPKYRISGAHSLRLNYGDDGRSEVIVDASDNIYLASCTQSTGGPAADNFKTTPGAFQPLPGGGVQVQPSPGGGAQDGVIIKTNPDLSTILFSSYLGGSSDDAAFVLALNPNDNNIYVAGGTSSTDLKGTNNGTVVNASLQGTIDGFVSIISNDGSSLLKTSYFGTTGVSTSVIYGIQFDKKGFPYIMGTTTGAWNVINAAFSQANGRQFISKLKPDLSGWVYSTVFGKGDNFPDLSPTAFLVDRCENVYFAGWGGGVDIQDGYENSGTSGLPTTTNALKTTTDGEDFYFFVLQRDATSQLYGSYFGQNNGRFGDHVDGGTSRYDKQGVIYEAICANCYGGANFPTTPGVAEPINRTTVGNQVRGCNEAVVKIAFNFAGVAAGLKSTLTGRGDSVGCIPLNVVFEDTVRNAKTYMWSFGDNTPEIATTNYLMQHTYTAVGTYLVRLIAIDPSSCNIMDTVYMTITAREDRAPLDFKYAKVGDCFSMGFDFINLSQAPAGKPFGNASFVWNFGDGGPPIGPKDTSFALHYFGAAGTYNVSLILVDSNYCNYPDTVTKPIYIAPNVKAQFGTPAAGCAPYTALFDNTSIAGQQYYWDFGDGTTSNDRIPAPHLYPNVGQYTVRLKVVDSATCNIVDSTLFIITVNVRPLAAFTYSPIPSLVNTPTVFTNGSSGGIRYKWMFGDGESATRITTDTLSHQYNRTDTFQACLVVINQYGCTDTVCHPVPAIVNPLLDVPNAFTPGRFGQNGIVKVVGFGITHIVFRIYNRWGNMLFESNDRNIGWDGTYNGVIQPMDVYAYTLVAEFFDGSRATKKGNITLLR